MADDISVLLDSLNIDSAFISGQSDGGILGLLLAIHHPNKVARLATYGANMFPGKKAVVDEVDDLVLDTLKVTTKLQHPEALFVNGLPASHHREGTATDQMPGTDHVGRQGCHPAGAFY